MTSDENLIGQGHFTDYTVNCGQKYERFHALHWEIGIILVKNAGKPIDIGGLIQVDPVVDER